MIEVGDGEDTRRGFAVVTSKLKREVMKLMFYGAFLLSIIRQLPGRRPSGCLLMPACCF